MQIVNTSSFNPSWGFFVVWGLFVGWGFLVWSSCIAIKTKRKRVCFVLLTTQYFIYKSISTPA